eukprot:TRINITY_DN8597_c0_g3_i3.p1 TRINITY_DN8597_c0_g3~~TRINITY_DN8597_c0_g3_i3.p1  ORF type:complete len:181 (+),score=44.41 TRINITY_DN8597_c0_g3_i3:277-819(+)
MKVVLLTAPSGSVTINGGMIMNSWYDIYSLGTGGKSGSYSRDDIVDNGKKIAEAIKKEEALLNNNSRRVFIGGFSQGCVMALHVGLSYSKPLGGIVGLSGYLAADVLTESEENKEVPILLSHGALDDLIPISLSRKSYDPLMQRKNIQYEVDPETGHGVGLKTLTCVNKWFQKYANFSSE